MILDGLNPYMEESVSHGSYTPEVACPTSLQYFATIKILFLSLDSSTNSMNSLVML
jgi:hypothetical protein